MPKNRRYKSCNAGETVRVAPDQGSLPEPGFCASPMVRGAVRRDESSVWIDPDVLPECSSLILHRLEDGQVMRVMKPPPLPWPLGTSLHDPVRRAGVLLVMAVLAASVLQGGPWAPMASVPLLMVAFVTAFQPDVHCPSFMTVRLSGDVSVNSVMDAAEALVRHKRHRHALIVVDRPSQRFWKNEVASGTGILSLACSRRLGVRMVVVPSLWMLDDTFERLQTDCRRFWHGVHLANMGCNISDALNWVNFIQFDEGDRDPDSSLSESCSSGSADCEFSFSLSASPSSTSPVSLVLSEDDVVLAESSS